MGLCSSRPWILQHLAMHMSRCCSFSIVACALHMTPLAAQASSTGRSLAVHYRPRVTNASCTSPIQKVGISATVSSGGYITFVDYCGLTAPLVYTSPSSQTSAKLHTQFIIIEYISSHEAPICKTVALSCSYILTGLIEAWPPAGNS